MLEWDRELSGKGRETEEEGKFNIIIHIHVFVHIHVHSERYEEYKLHNNSHWQLLNIYTCNYHSSTLTVYAKFQ